MKDARSKLGGPDTYAHYAAGWAIAGNTPFQYGKQVASSAGGNQNPLVIQLAEAASGTRAEYARSSST